MYEAGIIEYIAREWIRYGGDVDGITWSWMKIRDRVDEILNYTGEDNQQIHTTGNNPGA